MVHQLRHYVVSVGALVERLHFQATGKLRVGVPHQTGRQFFLPAGVQQNHSSSKVSAHCVHGSCIRGGLMGINR